MCDFENIIWEIESLVASIKLASSNVSADNPLNGENDTEIHARIERCVNALSELLEAHEAHD